MPLTPDAPKVAIKEEKAKRGKSPQVKHRLSFKETRELEALPQNIEALEKKKAEIIATLSSPEFYAKSAAARVTATNARLEVLEKELEESYQRWEELEQLAAKYGV